MSPLTVYDGFDCLPIMHDGFIKPINRRILHDIWIKPIGMEENDCLNDGLALGLPQEIGITPTFLRAL
jgi:hypothetical protein